MVRIPIACMRRATSRPMRPKPITPSTLPLISCASGGNGSPRAQAPLREKASNSNSRRASMMMIAIVRSATAALSTPGVLQIATPCLVAASMSMLL